jgi:hypothetical protein
MMIAVPATLLWLLLCCNTACATYSGHCYICRPLHVTCVAAASDAAIRGRCAHSMRQYTPLPPAPNEAPLGLGAQHMHCVQRG